MHTIARTPVRTVLMLASTTSTAWIYEHATPGALVTYSVTVERKWGGISHQVAGLTRLSDAVDAAHAQVGWGVKVQKVVAK